MSDIDRPALKEIMWQNMRTDLVSLVPWFADRDKVLCPICARPMSYDDLSLEHIIPRQAVADDPAEARSKIPRNERSGMTLLCRKPLLYKKERLYNNGCNSWKGRHYDKFLREVFRPNILQGGFTSRHHVAIVCAAYLGFFRQFGYQTALLPSGLLLRNQFFTPNKFVKQFPIDCQMVLTGDGKPDYTQDNHEFWSEPFDCWIDKNRAIVRMRNFVQSLPISRDPTIPIAKHLPYAPSRLQFRPDLSTVFD